MVLSAREKNQGRQGDRKNVGQEAAAPAELETLRKGWGVWGGVEAARRAEICRESIPGRGKACS